MSSIKRTSQQEPASGSGPGYVWYKSFNQTVGTALSIPVETLCNTGYYRTHTSDFARGHLPRVYEGAASLIYNPANRMTRTMQRLYRIDAKNLKDMDRLRAVGAHLVQNGHTVLQTKNALIFASGIIALGECSSTGCSPLEASAIGFDMGASALNFAAINRFNRGMKLLQSGSDGAALPLLRSTQHLVRGLSISQMIAGGLLIAVEAKHYIETGDANGSTITAGGLGLASGGVMFIRSSTKLRQATAATTTLQKNSILGFNAVRYGTLAQAGLFVFEAGFSSIGIIGNAYVLGDSIFDDDISPAQRLHNIISSVTGLTGGIIILIAVVISALYPPLMPLMFLPKLAGLGIIIGQSIYDHVDEWDSTEAAKSMLR